MEVSRVCLPAADIGGFLSVPGVVRSPVVKKNTAWCAWRSFESKMRPSLEHLTSKPCFLPISVIAVSQMLSFSPWRFTTACSKPEDLVKTRSDFLGAADNFPEKDKSAMATLTAAVLRLRRNSRRSERRFMSAPSHAKSLAMRSDMIHRNQLGAAPSKFPKLRRN